MARPILVLLHMRYASKPFRGMRIFPNDALSNIIQITKSCLLQTESISIESCEIGR